METAQGPAEPLGIVSFEVVVHRLQEIANKRHLPCRTSNSAFVLDIVGYTWGSRFDGLALHISRDITTNEHSISSISIGGRKYTLAIDDVHNE